MLGKECFLSRVIQVLSKMTQQYLHFKNKVAEPSGLFELQTSRITGVSREAKQGMTLLNEWLIAPYLNLL